MFAIDCVLCRTVSQVFACVLVPCVSNWCEKTVTVICPEVTMSNGPVLIYWMKYMIYSIPNLHRNHTLCCFGNESRILKEKKKKKKKKGKKMRKNKIKK